MPLMRSKDSKGPYYRWGHAGHGGHKYHYISNNKRSRELAKGKAMKQARAIERSKHRRVTGGKAPMISSSRRASRKVGDHSRAKTLAAYRRGTRAPRRQN